MLGEPKRQFPPTRVTLSRCCAQKQISILWVAVCGACLLLSGSACLGQARPAVNGRNATGALRLQRQRVVLKVMPPRQAALDEPLKMVLEYTVSLQGAAGKAVVSYHNVDTGQDFTKTVAIPLNRGKNTVEVVWEADKMLPAGLYVTSVTLMDASGEVVARYAPDPATVQSLMVSGGATRVMDVAAITRSIKDFPVWQKELEAAEAKAKAAGADTTRQHLLIVVLRDAAARSKEQIQLKYFDVLRSNHEFLKQRVPIVKAELEKDGGGSRSLAEARGRPAPHAAVHDSRRLFLRGRLRRCI